MSGDDFEKKISNTIKLNDNTQFKEKKWPRMSGYAELPRKSESAQASIAPLGKM